jgi:hypothetical protein
VSGCLATPPAALAERPACLINGFQAGASRLPFRFFVAMGVEFPPSKCK